MQLEETERNFDDFWGHHEQRLQQCLQLRKFEEDFKQVRLEFNIKQYINIKESSYSDIHLCCVWAAQLGFNNFSY